MMIQGVDDMNYSFDTLKKLYDDYSIIKDSKSGRTVIVSRENDKLLFAFEGPFAECVKFAHTWVFATRYNQSLNTTSISDSNISTNEYEKAFGASSRDTYNVIMESVVACLQESGRILKCEALIEEVKRQISNPHTEDIVKGLYAKKGGYSSFLYWSFKVAGMDEILEKAQEQSQKQERGLVA